VKIVVVVCVKKNDETFGSRKGKKEKKLVTERKRLESE